LVGRIGLLEREKHEAATRGDALEARMQGEIEMKNEVILRMVAQSEMRLTDQITSLLVNNNRLSEEVARIMRGSVAD